MAQTSLQITISTTENPRTPTDTPLQVVPITTTNQDIQFVGFVTPMLKFTGEGQGSNYPFYFQTIYDPYNQNVLETTGIYSKVYMKIKNRGVSLVVPDSVSVTEVSADTISLSNTDLQTTLNDILTRINCLETGSACPWESNSWYTEAVHY